MLQKSIFLDPVRFRIQVFENQQPKGAESGSGREPRGLHGPEGPSVRVRRQPIPPIGREPGPSGRPRHPLLQPEASRRIGLFRVRLLVPSGQGLQCRLTRCSLGALTSGDNWDWAILRLSRSLPE